MHTEQSTQQLALCCCSLWQHSFPLLDGVHRCWVGQQTSSLRAHQRETVIRDCLCLILSFTLLPLKGLGQFLRSFMAGYPHMGLVFIWVHSFIKQYSLCKIAKLHKNTYFLTKDTDSAEFVVGICKDKMQHHTKYTTSFAWSEKNEVNIAFLAISWVKVNIELLNTYEVDSCCAAFTDSVGFRGI